MKKDSNNTKLKIKSNSTTPSLNNFSNDESASDEKQKTPQQYSTPRYKSNNINPIGTDDINEKNDAYEMFQKG